jgi:hypothetical protein
MAHTTRYGNTYSDEEWKEVQEMYQQEGEEADRFFELKGELIAKAAGFLNRQFSDVPVNTFKAALNQSFEMDAKEVKFSSQEKAERFASAEKWIQAEMKKGGF